MGEEEKGEIERDEEGRMVKDEEGVVGMVRQRLEMDAMEADNVEEERPKKKKKVGKKRKRLWDVNVPLPFVTAARKIMRSNMKTWFKYNVLGMRLAMIVGERMAEYDWAAVGVSLAVFLKFYMPWNVSKKSSEKPCYPREVTVALVETLRSGGIADEEVKSADRDGLITMFENVVEGPDKYKLGGNSYNHRVGIMVEYLLEACARGEIEDTFEYAYERRMLPPFPDSAIFNGVLGSVALLLANTGTEMSQILAQRTKQEYLRSAEFELIKARELDKNTYAYLHNYTQVLDQLGEQGKAIRELEEFCNSHPYDVFAREDLLRRQPRKLRIARQLFRLDPLSKIALMTICSEVKDPIELACRHADRIDYGVKEAWVELVAQMRRDPANVEEIVWFRSRRHRWWPQVFFTTAQATIDLEEDVEMACAKATVAKSWIRERLFGSEYHIIVAGSEQLRRNEKGDEEVYDDNAQYDDERRSVSLGSASSSTSTSSVEALNDMDRKNHSMPTDTFHDNSSSEAQEAHAHDVEET